jgi:hypothetical protein
MRYAEVLADDETIRVRWILIAGSSNDTKLRPEMMAGQYGKLYIYPSNKRPTVEGMDTASRDYWDKMHIENFLNSIPQSKIKEIKEPTYISWAIQEAVIRESWRAKSESAKDVVTSVKRKMPTSSAAASSGQAPMDVDTEPATKKKRLPVTPNVADVKQQDHTPGPKEKVTQCRYWLTTGTCEWGDKCKYLHEGDTYKIEVSEEKGEYNYGRYSQVLKQRTESLQTNWPIDRYPVRQLVLTQINASENVTDYELRKDNHGNQHVVSKLSALTGEGLDVRFDNETYKYLRIGKIWFISQENPKMRESAKPWHEWIGTPLKGPDPKHRCYDKGALDWDSNHDCWFKDTQNRPKKFVAPHPPSGPSGTVAKKWKASGK